MMRHLSSKLPMAYGGFLLLIVFFVGCAAQPEQIEGIAAHPVTPVPQSQQSSQAASQQYLTGIGSYHAKSLQGDHAAYPALSRFIEEMAQKYGLNREYLNGLFSQAKRKQWTLDYVNKSDQSLKSKPVTGGWTRYKAQFLDERHIGAGVAFWQKYQSVLQRASRQYGVPAEYILGIIAVETGFGANVGNHRVIDALTTLGFDYQRRGEYFRGELENFLVMTAMEGIDPASRSAHLLERWGLGNSCPAVFCNGR